jgi:hypothetical protein
MTRFRLIIAAFMAVALMSLGAASCSTAPRPPASDTAGNLVYDVDDVIATVWFIYYVATCSTTPQGCFPSIGFGD